MVRVDEHDASLPLMGFLSEHGEELRKRFVKHFFMHVLMLHDYGYLTLKTMLQILERLNGAGDSFVKREVKEYKA